MKKNYISVYFKNSYFYIIIIKVISKINKFSLNIMELSYQDNSYAIYMLVFCFQLMWWESSKILIFKNYIDFKFIFYI